MDSLLAVMASDVPAVANKIQSILVPSYFPNPEEGSVSTQCASVLGPRASHKFICIAQIVGLFILHVHAQMLAVRDEANVEL